jgi:hypothetical protein
LQTWGTLAAAPEPAERLASLNKFGRYLMLPGGPHFLPDQHKGFFHIYRDAQVNHT